jgi:polyhydroxyalkanoate synthase
MDPNIFMSAISTALQSIIRNPEKQEKIKESLQQYTHKLNEYILNRMMGQIVDPPISLPERDKRFNHEKWETNFFFDIIKQVYLIFSEWFDQTINDEELDVSPDVRKQLRFYTQQIIHAMAPNNFAYLNPLVLEEAYKTGGISLMKGFMTMLEDLRQVKDPDMTNMTYFKLGENIATSKGTVIFRNDLIELIQYEPTTEKTFKKPILIVPPWINKYYVFDLSEEKSMIRWLLDRGRTVFIISWVNPDERHRYKTLESYALEGPKAAIEHIQKITDEETVDAIGYCLGGTLLICLAAYFSALKQKRLNSLTLLTTLIDFEDAGDLTTFMSEDYVQRIEKVMKEKGYLDGRIMARTFNMLRPSELVWAYVVNNYYLGKDPIPFDFLYWNSDNTNMPEAMHSNVLRFLYQENRLVSPETYTIDGNSIDLGAIKLPIYMMSTKDDHIAPWKATYKGIKLMKNASITFVLGGSGHVAGVINPPHKEKYGYWTNHEPNLNADEWQKTATEHAGSWWPHWHQWLSTLHDTQVSARAIKLPTLGEAPGSYALKLCK